MAEKRLQKEFRALCKEPVSHVVARPSPNNILEWRKLALYFIFFFELFSCVFWVSPYQFVMVSAEVDVEGVECGHMRHELAVFEMIFYYVLEGSEGTPFAVHPESWNPMWSVSSILTGLLSFMMDTSPTTGSVNSSDAEKQHLAKASLAFNCKNATFRKLFPEYVEKYNQLQQSEQQPAPEQESSELPRGDGSRPIVGPGNALGEGVKKVDTPIDQRRNKKQVFPTWMMLLLVSIFGVVMALPLLQL
ncbi:hypothetical protein Tsubulata_026406 [Turnera subulata]|uniref:UBC core domain-containing protein n=1 Tax=Turnera subulata TaxID=218843 RepID=A0A9Q0FBB3_9ROSI|nr:hypothetical protein Tsubulata_026406 [Turnera subulata]